MSDEIWKDIPGYERLYQISNYGNIYSLRNNIIRKSVRSGFGYRAIQLSDINGNKKRFYVHRLVGLVFLGEPQSKNNCCINHINLDKADNRVCNLEWVSHRQNMKHAYENGKIDFRRPIRRDNKTGTKGVYKHEGGYAVSICGRYIGWFKTLEDAVNARKNSEMEVLSGARD
jgi:hypothetical protein